MPLTKEKKQSILTDYRRHDKDTGSAESQIALLTTRINELTEHLKINSKDFACRRGLMKMVGRRRRLQAYFKTHSTPEQYKTLITKLQLRK
ncbi:MAG: 30S ribosomal protein S15 [Cyanobacteria bacterium]|nr:30S ribosomal protein S15 [Cyanobacteriota bacterium]